MLTAAVHTQTLSETYWRGDFETGDLDQWSYLLNPVGIALSRDHVAEGNYSARITIQGEPEYLWKNNAKLNRVELQYRPDPRRSGEDSDIYFGWSFMLPALLTRSRHEFGYWESSPSYRQITRFNLSGSSISFQVAGSQEPLWESAEAVKPEQWHAIAMHIHWSVDPENGYVSVWFDGKPVVNQAPAQTLVPGDDHVFIQLGILRDLADNTEEIYIDNAFESSSIEAVLARQSKQTETRPKL
ncbi:MAG TPA: heparin lyase I family protein [Gammaproteobacteria bacterium]